MSANKHKPVDAYSIVKAV